MKPSPPLNLGDRLKYGRVAALRQCLELQSVCYQAAIGETVKPADIAQLSRAWEVLEERKRILRNKPLPGSLKPETPKKTKVSQPWTPSE